MIELLPPGTIEAFCLYLVRTSALLLAAPLLGQTAGFTGYKIALVVTVSGLLYFATGAPLGADLGAGTLGLMALRELLIGLFLAFVLQVALLTMDVAGQIIGHEIGLTMSSVVDPITGVNTAIITHFYETFFFLGFLAVDGHHWVLRALDASFERAPVGVMELGADVTDTVLQIFGQMFAAGLTFAAPVMIVLALVSLLMGLLARAVPQLNILEVGFTLRIGVGFLGLFLFSPLITPALERIYALLMTGLDAAIDSIAP